MHPKSCRIKIAGLANSEEIEIGRHTTTEKRGERERERESRMGTASSKNSDSSSHGGEDGEDQAGGQLYVSLKMENYKLRGDLIPHVFGSAPIVGSWNSAKAVSPLSLSLCLSLVA